MHQRTHYPEKGFWVASLVLNSVGIELGLGSIEHLLNNASLVYEDFPATVNLDNPHRRSIFRLSFLADIISSLTQGAAGRIVSHLGFNDACFLKKATKNVTVLPATLL